MISDSEFVTQKQPHIPNYAYILAISCGTSLLIGIFVSSIAPLLIPIASSFKLPISQIALPVSIRSSGFLAGCMIISVLWTEKRAKFILNFAASIFAISLFFLGLPFINFSMLLGFLFISGIGFGLIIAGLNSLVSQISAHARTKNLTRLSIFFGVGAATGPLIVTFVLKQGIYWSTFHLILLFPAIIVLVLLARFRLHEVLLIKKTTSKQYISHQSSPIKHLSFWAVFFISLFVMGAQVCFSSLTPAFLVQVKDLATSFSNYAISLYWITFIIGGLLYAYLFSHRNLWLLIVIGVVSTMFFTFLTILSHQPWPILIAVACSGLFFSYLFPVIMSLSSTLFPLRIGFVTGGIMSTSGMGGIIFPSLIGITSNSIGFGNAFFLVPALLLFGLIILFVFRRITSF